jgi:hypothetical protein
LLYLATDFLKLVAMSVGAIREPLRQGPDLVGDHFKGLLPNLVLKLTRQLGLRFH